MPKHNKPNRGSMAFSPRKRARSETPHISSWAAVEGDDPKILGFAGYKVGMSHIMAVDYRKKSTTAGQEIRMPVTIVEIPPMKVIGARGYIQDTYGLRTLTEAWEGKIDKDLERTLLDKILFFAKSLTILFIFKLYCLGSGPKAVPPLTLEGFLIIPTLALPVPFCLYGLDPVPRTSDFPLDLLVPCLLAAISALIAK